MTTESDDRRKVKTIHSANTSHPRVVRFIFSFTPNRNDKNTRRVRIRYKCYFVYSVVIEYEPQVSGNDVSRHVSKTMCVYPHVGQFESVKRGKFMIRPSIRDRSAFRSVTETLCLRKKQKKRVTVIQRLRIIHKYFFLCCFKLHR